MKYCLGTVQFGMHYGIQGNEMPLQEKVFEMLDFAIDNGIEILDTASAYGDAEKILGAYIYTNQEKAKKIRIVSKLKPDVFALHEKDSWERIAIENAEESLDRLRIKMFAAYLFHNAAYIFDECAVEALEAVKRQGLTERIGVSIYTPEEAMRAMEYPSITAIQIPYNLFDQRLDACGFFKKAKEKDVLIFARSSLLQGLVMMDPQKLPPKVQFAKDYLRELLTICEEYEVSPLRAAVGYVGSKPEIDYVVFGVDNLAQLEEYISIRDLELPKEMIRRIGNTFVRVENRLINPVLWK